MLDLDTVATAEAIAKINAIEGVVKVRVIK